MYSSPEFDSFNHFLEPLFGDSMKNLFTLVLGLFLATPSFAVGDETQYLDQSHAQQVFLQYQSDIAPVLAAHGVPDSVAARDGHIQGGAIPEQISQKIDIDLMNPQGVYAGTVYIYLAGPDDDHIQVQNVEFIPVQHPATVSNK
jgi:hypothetical protein